MILPLLACLGGVPTVPSPCILPVLPYAFARVFTITFLDPGVKAQAFTFG